ncbi:hypothetical protein PORY_000383 [Pneumocystis oryctolagi]|uniref:Uncharacterized protein n=1 Tax=Pneumocystis oryctolagi TaxID=42067 RepID=A0ACB7CFS5_9ASCO|nr:hypothetical protein PORY_000383 [Pneumocystis oryctolagi]
MKHLAAYLLLELGGCANPKAHDIKKVLGSVGLEADDERLASLLSKLEGRSVEDLIAQGREKLVSVSSVGGMRDAGTASLPGQEGMQEEAAKEEEKEESDEDYNSLLAIASTNDLEQRARLEQLKKARILQKEKDFLREQQEYEKERQERARRLEERKKMLQEASVLDSTTNSPISIKTTPQITKKSFVDKKVDCCSKTKPMSFKDLMSYTSNINPEILKINPTVKRDSEFSSKDLVKKKPSLCPNNNSFSTYKIETKNSQAHKELTLSTKPQLKEKQHSLLKSIKLVSLPRKITINKVKKDYLLNRNLSKNPIKSKIISGFHPDDMVALRQGPKRDFRTIEEIQNDLWRKKGKTYPFLKNTTKTEDTVTNIPKKQIPKDSLFKDYSSAPKQDVFYKQVKANLINKNETLDCDISSEIWKVFGLKKEDYMLKDFDSDSDMEVTEAELQKEEEFSMRMGILEDKEEEYKETARKMNKRKK